MIFLLQPFPRMMMKYKSEKFNKPKKKPRSRHVLQEHFTLRLVGESTILGRSELPKKYQRGEKSSREKVEI